MKICIVGSGGQGTGLAGLLAREAEVERITLADVSVAAAEEALQVVQSLGAEVKVKDIQTDRVDASSRADVARAAKGEDILVNATIPICNIPIMEACLDAGVHYVDLLSLPFVLPGVDRTETLEAQLEMDQRFKDADLAAVPNVGVSPGWTDLAARYLVDQLDTVDQVVVRYGDWFDSVDLVACFSPSVMFSEWFGPPYPLCTEDGQARAVDLLESEELYLFPEPVGEVMIHTVTVHPEIVTIPKYCGKPVRRAEEKGGLKIGKWNQRDIWAEAVRRQTSTHTGADNMIDLFAQSFIPPTKWKEAQEKGIVKDGAVAFSVEATGTLEKKPARYTAFNVVTLAEAQKHLPWAPHGVYATIGGVPIEVVLRLGRGHITERGVVGVAALSNYKDILSGVASRGHQLSERLERTTLL